ncbi:MAG: hypothetical protein K9W44_02165 [Candidatus Lokiarchaeota archaeon]|nr:hypothetical protein [Candidatus Harpocratesius repetitus]
MNGQTIKKWTIIFFSIALVGVFVGFVITAIDYSVFSQVFSNLDISGKIGEIWMRIQSFVSDFSLLEKEAGGGGGTPG